MKNIYTLFKWAARIKSQRIKLLGITGLHILKKRYIGVFFDPVLACNFRCKMCYFSDPQKRKEMKGILSEPDIAKIAHSLFHRALKLQIGCGAEPLLYPNLAYIIGLGRQYNIPYISITTNGALLQEQALCDWAEAGLNELTLSAHGVTKDTYEMLMVNGSFSVFCETLSIVARVKKRYPELKLRLNYTINEDNVAELSTIFEAFDTFPIDILQLRPIQRLGDTEYNNFNLEKLFDSLESVIEPLIKTCKERDILLLYPSAKNLLALESENEGGSYISEATYCYVSPQICWKPDYNYHGDTFESYCKKHHITRSLLWRSIGPHKKTMVETTHKMNYKVE